MSRKTKYRPKFDRLEKTEKLESGELASFSIDEAEGWLHRVEEISTETRDREFATRYVVASLIMELHRMNLFDALSFLNGLRKDTDHIKESNLQIYARCFINDLIEDIGIEEMLFPKPPSGQTLH